MIRRSPLLIALLSLSVISLELIWTRLFSAEFYYTFAFLILSMAILGLGLGALALRLFPPLRQQRMLPISLSLSGLAALLGPPLVFGVALDFSTLLNGWQQIGKLVLTVVLLGLAFLFAGMALATLFRSDPSNIPQLYMADLVGAGGGVLLAVTTMNWLGTPAAALLSAVPVLLAAFIAARRWVKLLPAVIVAGMAVLSPRASAVLQLDRAERAPVTYTHWDAMAKIKVYDYAPDYRGINIDNAANSSVYGFDGNWNRPESEKFEFGIDVAYLIHRFPQCTFLSLGAGGGTDVLQALQAGATEIHAVEVNPHINRMMLVDDPHGWVLPPPPQPEKSTEGATPTPAPPRPTRIVPLAEFSGHIYRDSRVKVVTEDARSYIGRFDGKFDVIYSLSSNTFAALASGAFALAENYLFTTEAFEEYWQALSPGGFLTMEHQFYMPRIVSSLIDALHRQGVADPTAHFAVYDLPKIRRNLLLISKRPLDDEIRNNAFQPLTPERFEEIHLLFPAPPGLEGNLINRIVTKGWRAVAADAKVDVSPTTDERPFVGQMGRWRNLTPESLKKLSMLEVTGFPLSKVMILTILAVVLVLLVPLNLLPYLGTGDRLAPSPWLYFFTIGAAFMALEVVLIQKYTLFVGPSVYAVSTILLTLLVTSGVGSRFSARLPDWLPFAGIVTWVVLDVLVFRHLFVALGGLDMPARIAVSALLVTPLGLCMGMPFPKGVLRVGELVDWGFAVNGTASVLGATGILLVAFGFGLSAALLLAAALYVIAFVLLAARSTWRPPRQASQPAAS